MIYDLQRASMWKRISAWLLDTILLCIAATLMAFLLSAAVDYDSYSQRLDARYAHFEAEYGVSREVTQAQVDANIERERTMLSQQYMAAIAQAQADNDLQRAQALYEQAKADEAQLRQNQKNKQKQGQNTYAFHHFTFPTFTYPA